MKQIYMDHVATNPLHPEALDAMMPFLRENFGNPLSIYAAGMKAREAIENARASTADLINANQKEIIFTASGAEANNFAIKGIAYALQGLFKRQAKGQDMAWCHLFRSGINRHRDLLPSLLPGLAYHRPMGCPTGVGIAPCSTHGIYRQKLCSPASIGPLDILVAPP